MKLVPLADRVVLKQLEAEETTKSGIILASKSQAPAEWLTAKKLQCRYLLDRKSFIPNMPEQK